MTDNLSAAQVGNTFADAVERVSPGVVAVLGRKRLPATGTVWDSDETGAVIVTASHAVEREDQISIRLADDTDVAATLLGRDLTRDLAVLRVESAALNAAPIAAEKARVGTLAMAVGRPFVTSTQASFGSVVFVGSLQFRNFPTGQMIHADATLYPGFSGGPLIDAAGEVLGINTSGARQSGSITIPSPCVTRIVKDIVEIGHVRTAWVGITVQQVDLPDHIREEFPDQQTAVRVLGIEEGSPAGAAGLYVDDILVTVGDQPLEDVTDLQHILCDELIGESLTVIAWRAETRLEVNVTPIVRPEHHGD
jgi:S1-C subfamily serine protease